MSLSYGIPVADLVADDQLVVTMADIFQQRYREQEARKAKAAASRGAPGRSARNSRGRRR